MGVVLPPPDARATELAQRRDAKMARTPHAYVRGATRRHYEWLDAMTTQIPEGPAIWICGDCHLGNLGPIADSDGNIEIQIRDLDQTVIGNPAHDLIRLAVSLASAARGSNLPGITTAHMIEEMAAGYESGLVSPDGDQAAKEPAAIAVVRKLAFSRKWRDLARERVRNAAPTIPLGRKFWPLTDVEKREIESALASPAIMEWLVSISPKGWRDVVLREAAYWVKGCSSLGGLRYAALMQAGGKKGRFGLVDIKEAVRPLAPTARGAELPAHQGQRVAAGARALSPNLGERIATATLLGRDAFVRELLPEDLKLEIEQFTRREAVRSARYLAAVVGKAHGRQLADDDRAAWLREINKRRAPDLDAPSWLWTVVVRLLVLHEEAYLAHCRALLRATAPAGVRG